MGDALCLAAFAIHIDRVAAVALEPDVNIDLVAVAAIHHVEDTALCGDDGDHTAVLRHEAGQGFAAAIVSEEPRRLQLRQSFQLIIQHVQLCFILPFAGLLQFLLLGIDLPLQGFALAPVGLDVGAAAAVVFVRIVAQRTGHVVHDAGLTLARWSNHHRVQAQRLVIAGAALNAVLGLQAHRQRSQPDDSCHIRGCLTVFRNGAHIGAQRLRQALHGERRQLAALRCQRLYRKELRLLRLSCGGGCRLCLPLPFGRVHLGAIPYSGLNRDLPIGGAGLLAIPFVAHQPGLPEHGVHHDGVASCPECQVTAQGLICFRVGGIAGDVA